jgi:hypothetical protein
MVCNGTIGKSENQGCIGDAKEIYKGREGSAEAEKKARI